jgi:hypothetical protein
MTHDYVRHGTTTLFAALNVLEGAVIECVSVEEFLKFLRQVDHQGMLMSGVIVDDEMQGSSPEGRRAN